MINRFKLRRTEKELTQQDVALFLNVSQAQVSRYEKEVDQLDYNGLRKLSLLYDTSIDYLLGLTNEIEPYKRRK